MSERLIKSGHVWGHGQCDIRIDGTRIKQIGADLQPNSAHTEIVDAENCVIYPGLVNTHHHLTQSIAKGVPAGINADLNGWLGAVPYALWDKMTPEVFYISAKLGFYELLRSGVTTCADHFYLYHLNFNFELEDALYQAAKDSGIRFVHCRGGATFTGTHRGFNKSPRALESIDDYLQRIDDTRSKHHDPAPDAMTKVVVAPTSIMHTSPPEDLKQLATYARDHQLKMHSHLLEVVHDQNVARDVYAMDAVDYAESTEWLGSDVWFAHLVHADGKTVAKLAATGTGIAHCPVSNCRLGSGIAPVPNMAAAGMPVSIGVDGSASAESGSMINELMMTWLLHRAVSGPQATKIEDVVHWGSRGGAEILGLTETGSIAEGMCADLAVISLDDLRFAGIWQPQWAPVICGEPVKVKRLFCNGRLVMEDGVPVGIDLTALQAEATGALAKLMNA